MSASDWARMWRPEQSPWETALRAVVVHVFVHIAFRIAGRKELGGHAAYDIVVVLFVGVAMRQTIVGSGLLAAMRSHGRERLAGVHRAYLERSGSISMVTEDA